MDDDREYNEKLNFTHPPMGANIKEQDKRAYVMEQTKKAIQEAVKEFREDKEILEKALLDGRLISEPQTYSEVLTKRFGSDFTKRFYGFSTISKDVLNKKPAPMPSDIDPQIQHGVLANAMTAFTNMHTAHEICINNSYRLKPSEKIDTMETRVTDLMRKTFWSLVDEDLEKDPPVYNHALIVLEEIKEKLLSLLLPHNGATRLRIEDNLDIVNIKKEIEKEEFEFEEAVKFIIDCLTRLCPQSREEQVNAIKSLKKPSEIFSHVFEILEMLKLDMTNFLISKYRPKIMEHCITYERQKFVEYLELEYDLTRDGLHSTRQWLLRHKIERRDTPTTIAKAFGEIVTWNYQHPWPETLALDGMRLANVSRVVKRATIFGAMSISVIEMCKPLFVRNYYVIYNTLRRDLDNRFKVLLPLKNMTDNALLAEDALVCAEEAVRVVAKQLQSFESKQLPEDVADLLREAVKNVLRPDNKIRSLLMMKAIQYIEESVFAESKYKVPLISGLSSIKVEVELSATEFCRIVLHNRNAYNDIYCDIIDGKLPNTTFNNNIKDHAYLHYLHKLKMIHRSSNSMAKEPLPGYTKEEEPEPDPTKSILKYGVAMSDIATAKNNASSLLPSHNIVSGQTDVDILKILAPHQNNTTAQPSENPSVVPSKTAVQGGIINLSSSLRVGSTNTQKTVQFKISQEPSEHAQDVKLSMIEMKSTPQETSDPAPEVSKLSVTPITKDSPESGILVHDDSKVDKVSPEASDPTQNTKKVSRTTSNIEIVPTTSKHSGIKEIEESAKIISAVPSEGRKSMILQLPEDDLNLGIDFVRHGSTSSLFNCPGSPAITWTPSASNYLSSFGSGNLSSLSDVSMDVNSNSQLPEDLDSEDDSIPTIAASESENYHQYMKQIGKYPEPVKKTSPGDITESPAYDDDASTTDSFLNMMSSLPPYLHGDRFPDEEVFHYAPQFIQNRTNPYLLSANAPDYLRFAHPLLNKKVKEYEELMNYFNEPPRVCNPTAKVKDAASWLDVEDIEGVNWKNHWILRKEAIYKHWRESREDRKSSDQELNIDDEVREAYARAKAIAEEENKLKSAKDKVYYFLEANEKEAMMQQKNDMEKIVEKSGKLCPGEQKKHN